VCTLAYSGSCSSAGGTESVELTSRLERRAYMFFEDMGFGRGDFAVRVGRLGFGGWVESSPLDSRVDCALKGYRVCV
jgi:hypothetical protein